MARQKLRRSRIELEGDMLQAIANGHGKPARIVYAVNLAYDRVTKILAVLEEKGLVEKVSEAPRRGTFLALAPSSRRRRNSAPTYGLTLAGRTTLDLYRQVKTSLSPLEATP